MRFLNLDNYRNKTYRYVILTCILSYVLIGNILTPLLNYHAIMLPSNNPNFYNYASLANIIPSLPFMLSILISYLINNLRYKSILWLTFASVITLSLIILLFPLANFYWLCAYVLACSILFRGLYFSLDKQLTTILADKVRDFQSDLVIWGGIFGAIDIKLSGYLYQNYQVRGIAAGFMLGCVLLWWCARQIPPVSQLEETAFSKKLHLPLTQVIQRLWQHPQLVSLLFIILLLMLANSPYYILITTKIHHDQISLSHYTTLNSLAMFVGIIGALLYKTKLFSQFSAKNTLIILVFLYGLTLLGLSLSVNFYQFGLMYILGNLLSGVLAIHILTLALQQISLSPNLSAISPLINGILASLFYLASLVGQTGTNLALNHAISYKTILIAMFILQLICIGGLFLRKTDHEN